MPNRDGQKTTVPLKRANMKGTKQNQIFTNTSCSRILYNTAAAQCRSTVANLVGKWCGDDTGLCDEDSEILKFP